jgi:anion-transporting  ArsA/GET3 family ATPase
VSADVAELLEGRSICICAGAGGVGKTTTAAAVAAGMAARGMKVAVLTIDPAKRLADSLGLAELGNEPARVAPELFERAGVDPGEGELWAMMLDPKATFDEVVRTHAPDAETRERILDNRIYREISNALAGSQEYMAMEKLYEVAERGEFDLLVLDTPPTRNALDFLDAPRRLTQFIEGRSLQLFLRPSGLGMRVLGRGTSVVFGVLRRVTGLDLIEDLREFFGAMSGMVGGFRERAERVGELLTDPGTGFLVVCGPAGAPLEEAVYFHRKLDETGMPFAGVIVNRVHRDGQGEQPDDLGKRLAQTLGDEGLAGRVLANYADLHALAARDARNVAGLRRELAGTPVIEVPYLREDIHDLAGLFALNRFLFAASEGPGE